MPGKATVRLCEATPAKRVGPSRSGTPFPQRCFSLILGYGDLECHGQPYVPPHLDRLVEPGTRFAPFYSTGLTCCPARTGLMAGELPATFKGYPAVYGLRIRVNIAIDPAGTQNVAAKNRTW